MSKNTTTYQVTAYVERGLEGDRPAWLWDARFRDEPTARRFAAFCLMCIHLSSADRPARYSCELTQSPWGRRTALDTGWESGSGGPEVVDTAHLDDRSGTVVWASSLRPPPAPNPGRLRLVKPSAGNGSETR